MTTAAFPNQPTLSATPQSDTAIALSWTNVPRETGFLVQQLSGGTWTTIATLGSGVTTYTNTGLHEATSYSYQVIATSSAGNSAQRHADRIHATDRASEPHGDGCFRRADQSGLDRPIGGRDGLCHRSVEQTGPRGSRPVRRLRTRFRSTPGVRSMGRQPTISGSARRSARTSIPSPPQRPAPRRDTPIRRGP